jgi:DNA replication protein DnaC
MMISPACCCASACGRRLKVWMICWRGRSNSSGRIGNCWKSWRGPQTAAKAARNLERRLQAARIGRFKPLADFDWNWPKKIDRQLIERWLRLEPIAEGRNLILLGSNGVGKTTIARNAAYQAVMAGRSALFRTASELISDLSCSCAAIAQAEAAALRTSGLVMHR